MAASTITEGHWTYAYLGCQQKELVYILQPDEPCSLCPMFPHYVAMDVLGEVHLLEHSNKRLFLCPTEISWRYIHEERVPGLSPKEGCGC